MSPPRRAKPPSADPAIARNRRARHDYFLEETLEAGLALLGWEVKALRGGRAQISESYVVVRGGEGWLLGSHIQPLPQAADQSADPARPRKLLLHARELGRLTGAAERQGYALVPLSLYWKRGRAKLQLALARGKRQHDRRQAVRQREWARDRARALRRDA